MKKIKNEQFKDLRIVDNFYQTSLFFPMPLCLIGTIDEATGITSFGAYSLVFPYYIAGKDHYTMLLECRNSSNTCKGLLTSKKCTINFLPYNKKYFKEHVRLGFPGDTAEEKMKDFMFTAVDGKMKEQDPEGNYPKIIDEALQVMECSWLDYLDNAQDDKVQEEYLGPYHDFNGITSKFGAHFILKVDKILMKERYYDAIINGVTEKNFMPLPSNWGYRDSKNFWCSDFSKAKSQDILEKEVNLESLRYAAERVDDKVKFTDEALYMLRNVPRPFLKLVLSGCVSWAKENGVSVIGEAEMKIINDKRSKEKARK